MAWGEADITCLVDEKGVVKVCLQELCSKVCWHSQFQWHPQVQMLCNLSNAQFQMDTSPEEKLHFMYLLFAEF